MAMLTDMPYLPDHTDPTRANFSSLITMDQLLEIGQERSHPKPSADQENALVFPHWGTDSMRSTEQHPAGAECAAPFAGLSVIQELPGQSSARFHKQFQLVLLLVRPGRHHERMTLQKGREAYGRNPQVDVLSGFDLQRPGKCNLNLDRAFGVSDESSGTTVAEVPIPPQDANALDD